MRDYDFWADDSTTIRNQKTNYKAFSNQRHTINLINSIGGLKGDILDIGSRNYMTELLEKTFNVRIDSTKGDLDLQLLAPKTKYDFIHYNNVIEHQFNPLFTLLEIKKHLKQDGILILGTPLKPNWITFANCHFHEFNEYQYRKLIRRAGYEEVKRVHFYYQISVKGIRQILGSFYKRQVVSILKHKFDI
ncbi:MAG TPA: methyltransferase domain-containing protein [Tenuifilaceae bacterium]|nr:methyltransferase domain-containing protein [Tenuifilaceae bacterium]